MTEIQMIDIVLYTHDGAVVTTVKCPPFLILPEALLWGSRFFIRRDDDKYYEGFVHYIVPDVQHEEGNGKCPTA